MLSINAGRRATRLKTATHRARLKRSKSSNLLARLRADEVPTTLTEGAAVTGESLIQVVTPWNLPAG